jgi:hypothetical protein
MITEQVYPLPPIVSHSYSGPQCSAYKTFTELIDTHPVHRDHGMHVPLHTNALPSDRTVWASLRPRRRYGHNKRFHRFRWLKSMHERRPLEDERDQRDQHADHVAPWKA